MAKHYFNIAAAFIIIGIYVAARFIIYVHVPSHDFISWLVRDTVMTVPRLLCGLLALWALWKSQSLRKIFIRGEAPPLFFVYATSIFLIEFIYRNASVDQVVLTSPSILYTIAGTTIFVAFFEELLFSGLLFGELSKALGEIKAIFLTAVIFMLFHTQAQDVLYFPYLFLIGAMTYTLRARGVALIYLIGLHYLYDVFILLLLSPAFNLTRYMLYLISLIIVFCILYLDLTRTRKNKIIFSEP